MASLVVDAYRYVGKPNLGLIWKAFYSVPGFRFMYLKRSCERFSKYHPVGLIVRFWYGRLQVKYGYQIPHTTKIGNGLFLGHFGGVVINQQVVIGSNCNIAQGVTIGIVNRGSKKGCPVIGDRVWIGANAVIVGNIKIGNDVLIAPLSYVIDDVPDQAVVVGNPAQIINSNGSKDYINSILLT